MNAKRSPLDEPEAWRAEVPASELRSQRQKELVEEVRSDELTKHMRATFAEYEARSEPLGD
jgi:hypothetical protein